MPRFYVDTELHAGRTLALPAEVVRHVQVLRLAAGDTLTLFNGDGGEHPATLLELGKRDALVAVDARLDVSRESPLTIGLAQAISSGDRMEFTLQKGVEMGVTVFQPLASARAVVKLSGERADKRVARWQEIVVAACEQCGRNTVPEVRPILTLPQWLADTPEADARLLLSPQGQGRLADLASAPRKLWLMAGPEGGYTDAEEAAAIEAGWTPLTLGPRVLRTETAALAAVAALQTVWGDYASA